MPAESTPPLPPGNPAAPADDDEKGGIKDEIALCLSGGGYRAMIFHLGTLIRLNEVGLLGKLKRVSSVSGGSITAGVLGMKWKNLKFDATGVATNLDEQVIQPVRKFGGVTIDAESIIGGILNPFRSISDNISKAYRKHLFGDATLQDLPSDAEGPRFIINATNIQSGALWRFSKPYMGDYKVGRTFNPKFSLAVAVTASSAFPPILSPVHLDLKGYVFQPDEHSTLTKPPYITEAVLSDGGVYDNMGLETAWKRCKTLLVSDAGAAFQPQEDPATDWARHSIRVLDVIDNQVRSLRRIALMQSLKAKTEHEGAYWNIAGKYPASGTLNCPPDRAGELAKTPTRLAELDSAYQDRLINWGYAITAANTDNFYPGPIPKQPQFPCPGGI